jgi:hypothetical protein
MVPLTNGLGFNAATTGGFTIRENRDAFIIWTSDAELAEGTRFLIEQRELTAGSNPAWSSTLLRYASGEAARLSIGREGFDLPTERQIYAEHDLSC